MILPRIHTIHFRDICNFPDTQSKEHTHTDRVAIFEQLISHTYIELSKHRTASFTAIHICIHSIGKYILQRRATVNVNFIRIDQTFHFKTSRLFKMATCCSAWLAHSTSNKSIILLFFE